jgi:hypothetical protein
MGYYGLSIGYLFLGPGKSIPVSCPAIALQIPDNNTELALYPFNQMQFWLYSINAIKMDL